MGIDSITVQLHPVMAYILDNTSDNQSTEIASFRFRSSCTMSWHTCTYWTILAATRARNPHPLGKLRGRRSYDVSSFIGIQNSCMSQRRRFYNFGGVLRWFHWMMSLDNPQCVPRWRESRRDDDIFVSVNNHWVFDEIAYILIPLVLSLSVIVLR